jgi:hypothetical protein
MYVCVQVINLPFFFIHRLKIHHKSRGSYVFILERGIAANSSKGMGMTGNKKIP